MAIVGGGLAAVCIAWAGLLVMMSMGEPMKVAQARTAVIGAVVGLILVGLAFVIPAAVSEVVVEPAGGMVAVSDVGLDCDRVLRRALVEYRTASTGERIQEMVQHIQLRRDECRVETWSPVTKVAYVPTACFLGSGTALTVGGMPVPGSFYRMDVDTMKPHRLATRDQANNILVYWSDKCDERPSDGALCWLYMASLKQWSSSTGVIDCLLQGKEEEVVTP